MFTTICKIGVKSSETPMNSRYQEIDKKCLKLLVDKGFTLFQRLKSLFLITFRGCLHT
jgi:hypothetical protein